MVAKSANGSSSSTVITSVEVTLADSNPWGGGHEIPTPSLIDHAFLSNEVEIGASAAASVLESGSDVTVWTRIGEHSIRKSCVYGPCCQAQLRQPLVDPVDPSKRRSIAAPIQELRLDFFLRARLHRSASNRESVYMPSPTVDDHFDIVTSTAYWMAKQLPFRVQRTPLIRVGSAALARAIASHDPAMDLGLETWCRQEVRRAIRDFITDRYEAS